MPDPGQPEPNLRNVQIRRPWSELVKLCRPCHKAAPANSANGMSCPVGCSWLQCVRGGCPVLHKEPPLQRADLHPRKKISRTLTWQEWSHIHCSQQLTIFTPCWHRSNSRCSYARANLLSVQAGPRVHSDSPGAAATLQGI